MLQIGTAQPQSVFVLCLVLSIWKIYLFVPNKELEKSFIQNSWLCKHCYHIEVLVYRYIKQLLIAADRCRYHIFNFNRLRTYLPFILWPIDCSFYLASHLTKSAAVKWKASLWKGKFSKHINERKLKINLEKMSFHIDMHQENHANVSSLATPLIPITGPS